jgi:hypothetical protein
LANDGVLHSSLYSTQIFRNPLKNAFAENISSQRRWINAPNSSLNIFVLGYEFRCPPESRVCPDRQSIRVKNRTLESKRTGELFGIVDALLGNSQSQLYPFVRYLIAIARKSRTKQ